MQRWRSIYDPVFSSALFLGEKLGLDVTPLFFGKGEIPDYVTKLPFADIHRLDRDLPENIDTYDLISFVEQYIMSNSSQSVISPADSGVFPLLPGALASNLQWPYVASVTSMEVFNNREIYVVRPTIGGILAQIAFNPMVLAVSSSPIPLSSFGNREEVIVPVDFSVESMGKDKLLVFARAEMAPTPEVIPTQTSPLIHSDEEAIQWLFED
ncbi:hypothetical protein KKF84_02820 [Myxococcota bacterium]|nr:hypothetical protein [Myxococcota bacterium]